MDSAILYKTYMTRDASTQPNTIESIETSIARHPVRTLLIALFITLIAGGIALQLPIVTSRKALFPQDTKVLVRLNRFLKEFGSGSDLMVVIKGAPVPVLKQFATQYARRVQKLPDVREATERLDTDFFFKHSYLMIPASMLGQLRQWVAKNEKVIKVPGTITLKQALDRINKWLDDPPDFSVGKLDMKAAKQGLNRADFVLSQWLRWVTATRQPKSIPWERLTNRPEAERFLRGGGYFMSHDDKFLVMLVTPNNTSEEFSVLDPFIRGVRRIGNELRAEYKKQGKPVPTIGFTGLPAIEHEEYKAIRADIRLIVVTAGIFVLFLILFWMRSWRRALVIFIPMGLGTIWNAALTLGTVGHLTLITAGFTAILFGMGVDYGIFMSSRISEEVAKGLELPIAIGRGAAASTRALVTAGGATTLIFASLYFVRFKGFSELGLVAATGVFMVLLATFSVLPAVYALLKPPVEVKAKNEQDLPIPKPKWQPSWWMSLAIVIVGLSTATLGVWKGHKLPFDYNVLALLPKDSEAARYQKLLVKKSDFQPEVIIFTAPNIEKAREITAKAKQCPSLSSVQSIVDLFPRDIKARLDLAHKIGARVAASGVVSVLQQQPDVNLTPQDAKRLAATLDKAADLVDDFEDQAFSTGHKALVSGLERSRNILKKLSGFAKKDPKRFATRTSALFNLMLHSARKVATMLSDWQHAVPMTPQDLPASLRNRFFSKDGKEVAVYAYPRKSVYDMHNLDHLMNDVYGISKSATGFPTTHQVFSRMAVNSFKQGTLWALIVALLWILLSVRSLRGFIVAAIPLLVGEGWLMGIMWAFGIKYNYANIVAVPLVMALAVDYGVWFAHRRRELINLSAWVAGAAAARAIMLAAGTTLAGLGAIMMASYRGVASMGQAITIGLVACIIAALVLAPAIDQLFWRSK